MTTPTLPPFADERVDALERRVFARIADDRRSRKTRRTRVLGAAAAAAAVIVVAAVIAPGLGTRMEGAGSSSADSAVVLPGAESGVDPGLVPVDPGSGLVDVSGGAAGSASAGREIVASASATLEVDEVPAAIEAIADAATSVGGYVESSQVGAGGVVRPIDQAQPEIPDASSGGITVRVPAESLSTVMDDLDGLGTVTDETVTRSDVTDQAVDLRARVAAAEASVARLTELVAQAASVADLITAESALADRQAQLDADRQQLELLESQIALSSLSVQVQTAPEAVAADPAGFGDGLVAGWNGLVATLNGIVIGLGFLLPWLIVGGVVAAVVWGVRRVIRRRRPAA
ncbi:DUF4349 domain-containing protein [Microbacterium sp. LMI1-1-1.1]|uniref:DUF4349 domain-containing protein n=1 Tax=Microbacterium sp. LMI1-1-1.1 TaxID=3135223 RepID=UPI003466A23F